MVSSVYTARNPIIKYIHRSRLETIKKLAGDCTGKLLDCGCGRGLLLSMFNCELVGVDILDEHLEDAKAKVPNARLIKANLNCLPFEDDFFDIVLCSEVLEHIPSYKRAISEIVRVAKVGGRIVISVPNERNWTIGRALMLRFPPKIVDHVNSFKYRDLVDSFGFEPEIAKYIPFGNYNLALTQIYCFRK